MKKTVKLLALICAIAMLVSLAACGDSAEKKDDAASQSADSSPEAVTEAPASALADYEWIKFEMPAGWVETPESDYYTTISEEGNSDHIVKFFDHTYGSTTDLAQIVADDAAYDPDRYQVGEAFELNGIKWIPEYFKFNGNGSVTVYAEIDEKHYCEITIYEQTETAEVIKNLLSSIEFDAAKLG